MRIDPAELVKAALYVGMQVEVGKNAAGAVIASSDGKDVRPEALVLVMHADDHRFKALIQELSEQGESVFADDQPSAPVDPLRN